MSDYTIEPTGPLTRGSIPDADLDRLIDATIPAPSWRDYLGRLTPQQIHELEYCEREQVPPGLYTPEAAVRMAEKFVRLNEAATRFSDVPRPRGAVGPVGGWIDWDDDEYTRSFTAFQKVIDCTSREQLAAGHTAQVTIEVNGWQSSRDGSTTQNVYVDGDALEYLSAEQARLLARALIAAADKLDRLNEDAPPFQ